jgi:hypothetical protein
MSVAQSGRHHASGRAVHASMIAHARSHAGSPAGGLAVLALEGGCEEGLGLLPPDPQPASAASTSVGIIARVFIG